MFFEQVTDSAGAAQANGLRLEITDPASGLPVGTTIVIGHVQAQASRGPAGRRDGPRHVDRARGHDPGAGRRHRARGDDDRARDDRAGDHRARGPPAAAAHGRGAGAAGAGAGPGQPGHHHPQPRPAAAAPRAAHPGRAERRLPAELRGLRLPGLRPGELHRHVRRGRGPTSDWHHGNDIFAPEGTPVLAVADGTLSKVGINALGGNRLWLTDRRGNSFYYAHLSAFAPSAVDGAQVRAGQVVGFVGHTGDAETTPPHLHFEVHPGDGDSVDPYPYLIAWQRKTQVPQAFQAATVAVGPGPGRRRHPGGPDPGDRRRAPGRLRPGGRRALGGGPGAVRLGGGHPCPVAGPSGASGRRDATGGEVPVFGPW